MFNSKVKKGLAKSTVPTETGLTNPAYDRVEYLVDKTPDIRALMIQIQQLAALGLSAAEIKVRMQGKMRTDLQQIYHKFKSIPDTPPILAAPPPAGEIYGRFGTAVKVVDIGSGNGTKVAQYTGSLTLCCVDPRLDMGKSTARQVTRSIQEYYPTLTHREGRRFSSFMSLCQLEPEWQRIILGHDGLHMVPDHSFLLKVGAAYQENDRITVNAPRYSFSDFPIEQIGGFSIKPGYLILAGFEKRTIDIYLDSIPRKVDYEPFIQASPIAYTDINLDDVSYKMDGTPYELENNEGKITMVDRSGTEYYGHTAGKVHFCLHLEKLSKCFTLIRIKAINGIVPPHCYDVMQHFIKRTRIKINGMPLCMPPSWGAGKTVRYTDEYGKLHHFEEKTDGIISRHQQRDYYTKFRWTVDIRPDIEEELRALLKNRGWTLEANLQPGLFEYGMDRHDYVVSLSPLRPRSDKNKPTSLETIDFLLDQRTAPEILALN